MSPTSFQAALDTKHKMVATEKLTLLHFNDVYNVKSRDKVEPVGGAARMRTAFKKYTDRNPLVLFSGDCFAPSMCKLAIFIVHLNFSIIKLLYYCYFFTHSTIISFSEYFHKRRTDDSCAEQVGNSLRSFRKS